MALKPFIPNPNFAQDISGQDDYRAGLLGQAERAASTSNQIADQIGAPWLPPQQRGWASGSDVIVADDNGESVFLVNKDFAAAFQEWGGRNNPPFAPLRRGAIAAGLRFKETPK